jgi:hypothetical protein
VAFHLAHAVDWLTVRYMKDCPPQRTARLLKKKRPFEESEEKIGSTCAPEGARMLYSAQPLGIPVQFTYTGGPGVELLTSLQTLTGTSRMGPLGIANRT